MQNAKRGEVWWVSLDRSVGGEIRKTRAAVIVSNNAADAVLNRIVVVPISSETAKLYRPKHWSPSMVSIARQWQIR